MGKWRVRKKGVEIPILFDCITHISFDILNLFPSKGKTFTGVRSSDRGALRSTAHENINKTSGGCLSGGWEI